MKAVLSVVLVCLFALAFPVVGSAAGWAGSRYDKDDCTYDAESDMLSCEAWFTEEFFTTAPLGISDPTCASTIRLVERTGWQVTTYRGWSIYFGRAPVQHHEFVGNEDSFAVTWRDYSDVDLGCLL